MNWCDILVVCTMHAWCCCIVKDNREIAANALLIVVAVTATAAKPTQAEWERQRALRLDWYSSKRGSLTLWWLTFFSHGDVVFHSRRRVSRFVFMAVKNKCVPMKKKKRRKVSHVSPSTVERSCCALSSRICQSTWLHAFSIFLYSFCYFLLSNSIYSITFFLSASRTMETWLNMHQWHFEMFDYFASWNVRVSVLYHKYYKTQMLHYSDFVWKSNCESCSRAAMSI